METTWKNIRSNLIKGYRSVSEKTGDLTKIGRLKLEIIATKRDLEKAFIELGGRVYDSFKNHSQNELLDDPAVVKLVEKIKEKKENLNNLKEKVEQIRNQHVVIIDK